MPTKTKCYRQNFLSQVILRADFGTSPIELLSERTKFTDAIAKKFPHVSQKSLVSVQFEVTPGEPGNVKHTPIGNQWTHTKTVAGTAKTVLSTQFLSLEYGPGDYESFDAFFKEFTFLTKQLTKTFGAFPLDRIGLRYVNEIRLPGKAMDWEDIVRKEMVTAVTTPSATGGRLLRSMHQVVELHEQDQVLLNYGLFNPDFPAPAVQRYFVIDVDCSRTGVIPINEALTCVKKLNDRAGEVFESSIEDGLREIMGVIE